MSQLLLSRIAKFDEHNRKPRPRYYKWKIFSTAVLTLNFDLDLEKLIAKYGADDEHLRQIS